MEIEINGTLAELGNSEPSITKKFIDIENPSSRFIDFTNSFILPDTVVNRQIFDSPRGVGTNNRSFEKQYDVLIRDAFVIFRGKGSLDSSDKNTFKIQVLDNSKDLFNMLEVKLNSVSWDDEDTELSQTEINALDTLDPTNCWFWGKACYHIDALQVNTDQTTGDIRCAYSRPSFYIQALLKRIIENQGYTFTVPDPALCLSSNHKDFFFTSYQKTIDTTYNPAGTLAITGLDTNDFEHADLTVASGTINIGTFATKFRFRGAITATANVDLIVRATDNSDPTKVQESVCKINADDTSIDFESNEFQSDNGYTIDIYFSGTASVVFDEVLLYTLLSDETEDLSTNPWLDYKIKAHDNLPDLTYTDLFRTICVVSNQYQDIDTFAKTFAFGSLADLNKINSKDWSEKFVIDSQSINQKFKDIARRNNLKYTNDITVERTLGEDYFPTDNDNLPDEVDYITLPFGASNEVEINSNTIAHVRIYNDTTRIQDQEIAVRLFIADTDKLQFAAIDWKNIKSSYYENWFNSLYRIRAVTCLMNLNKLDVLSWSENDLVFIDYFNSTFIVLEINNFIPGKVTKVKLLNYGRS